MADDDVRESSSSPRTNRRLLLHGAVLAGIALTSTQLSAQAADRDGASPAAASLNFEEIKMTVSGVVNGTATGYLPGETLALIWFENLSVTTLKTFPANGSGNASFSFKVPEASGGMHTVRVRGLTSNRRDDATLEVIPKVVAKLGFRLSGVDQFVQYFTPTLTGFPPNTNVAVRVLNASNNVVLTINVPISNLGSGGEPFYPLSPTLPGGTYKVRARIGAGPVLASTTVTMPAWVNP